MNSPLANDLAHELTNDLGRARAVALFDALRIADSRRMTPAQENALADNIIKHYIEPATDRLASHLARRGFVFPDAIELDPELLEDGVTDSEVAEMTDDEIDAIATRASIEPADDETL